MDLLDWIDHHAGFTPDKPALVGESVTLTYQELALLAAKMAGMLEKAGVVKGERVAWLGQNAPEMLGLLFACSRLGAILVPVNWRLAPPEVAYILKDCSPKLLIVEPGFIKAVAQTAESLPAMHRLTTGEKQEGYPSLADALKAAEPTAARRGDPASGAVICYTSGTTGQPKGALLTQDALFWNTVNSAHMHALTQHDRVLTTLPMFHVGGLNIQTLPALHAGATVYLHAKFDPDACLAALERDRITLTVLVPTQLHAMMVNPKWQSADFSSLRMVTTGSTLVPPALIKALGERGLPLVQVYGSTETAPIAAYLTVDGIKTKPQSTGKAALHCEIRLVDHLGHDVPQGQDGEILVKGPNLMSFYWGDAEATANALENGWFHTGDIGCFDEDGYLIVNDRMKDMIISGGENIYPSQLEQILAECPAIAECAVVGRPDQHWGEIAVAVIVRKAEAKLDEDGVMRLFQGRVARYKHPRLVIFADHLPRNAMGKVVKGEVRRMAKEEETA
jgi:fatty-acyl-CoA synthase